MTSDGQAGMVHTVTGPIISENLGRTLTHEHLLLDGTDS